MRTWCLALTLVIGLGLGLVAGVPAPAAEKATAERIAKLIEQLGSPSFDEREQANRLLDDIGTPALEALRKAAQSNDPEVRRRAEDLVRKIERRGENAQLLAPQRVRLVCKDTPVAEAVAELAKKSGYGIALYDPQKKLADRKVTLDTGETTFWQALDQLCEKASLVELGAPGTTVPVPPRPNPRPLPRPVPQPVPPGKIQIQPAPVPVPVPQPLPEKQGGAVQAEVGVAVAAEQAGAPGAAPAGQPAQAQPPVAAKAVPPPPLDRPDVMPIGAPNQITLLDGKPKALPTCYSGAVRIQALPGMGGAPRRNADEIALLLQVSPEPKIQWQNLIGVKVEKAVDERGQNLQALAGDNPADPNTPVGVNGVVAGFVAPGTIRYGGPHAQVPVRLKKADKDVKSLKELEGTISAQVWGPPQAMIRVDNVLKAGNDPVKGKDGGSIKVIEAKREADDKITIKVELQVPPNVLPAGQLGGGGGYYYDVMPGGPIQIQPVPLPVPLPAPVPPAPNGLQVQPAQGAAQVKIQIAPAFEPVGPRGSNSMGLTVMDDKGQPVQPASVRQTYVRNGNTVTLQHTLTFPPQKGETVPLVFSGSRTVTLDIPFKLKDMPLQ